MTFDVEKLNEWMRNYKFSQTDVANYIGVSQPVVSTYLRGKNEPSEETRDKIAELMEVSPSSLIVESKEDEREAIINEINMLLRKLAGLESTPVEAKPVKPVKPRKWDATPLIEYMKKNKIDRSQMARRLGISNAALGNYLRYRNYPMRPIQILISEIIGGEQ